MSGMEEGITAAPAQPATLHMTSVDEPEATNDKRFLFSEGGSARPVWLVRGYQVPKVPVLAGLAAILAVLCLLLLVWCAVLAAATAGPPPPPPECRATGCLQQAANIAGYINTSASPCTDFYEYACGRFDDVHPLDTRISYGIQEVLEAENQLRIEELLERSQFHNDFSAVSKVRTFYRTCMDAAHGNSSAERLRELVNSLGGTDLFGTFDPEKFEFIDKFVQTREVNRLRLFFSITWLQTLGRVLISPPRLGMEDKMLYTDDTSEARAARASYRQSIVAVLRLLEAELPADVAQNRTCNATCPERMADSVLHLETQLVEAMPTKSHVLPAPANVMSLDALLRLSPRFEWRRLLDSLFGKNVVANSSSVQVPSKEYMTNLNAIVERSNASLLNDYIQWNLIRQYLPAAGPIYAVLAQEMDTVTRRLATRPRQAICFDLLRRYFPRALRALFIADHIGESNVAAARRMVGRVRDQLGRSFDWMTPDSRTQSQTVLGSMGVSYGHAPWVTDERRLNNYYAGLTLTGRDFFTNLLNADRFKAGELKANAARLASSGNNHADDDGDDEDAIWVDGDATTDVKVTYNPVRDRLRVPPGGLQVPLFSHHSPDYVNAATFGSLVLAELAGPFFLRHRTYRLPSWWDSETTARYRQYGLCLMDSLGGYTVDVQRSFEFTSVRGSGTHRKSRVPLDPRKSANYLQAEHLAFILSYDLFKHIQKEDGPQRVLPGTEGQTPEQLFFLTYAQSRCRNTNPYLRVLLNSAFKEFPHPEMINNFVYNFPAFREAYQCQRIPEPHQGRHCTLS
ncbi:endothelin-converting enzyme-like 1 [Amphibalanus amphitrite]|uniref:endothelin-converting enzyme-like 1 n=1 Tax=Amphibalanus amphitrite TaxID=1232801 RepID=UPI001C8FEE2D|nr:endothelin-converting enzyme-like 1 [Amphibalanus amphitrite]